MCDPVSIGIGVLGGAVTSKALAPKAQRTAAAADPEAERMKAEADAAATANRKLAADQQRRRGQQSLVARGAPSLGDEQNTGEGVINTGSAAAPVRFGGSRDSGSFIRPRAQFSTTQPQPSLMSRGSVNTKPGRQGREYLL
jgi:hypothetical protein